MSTGRTISVSSSGGGSLPAGGDIDNVLVKQSAAANDADWQNTVTLQAVMVAPAEGDITNAYIGATATQFSYGGDVVGVPMSLVAWDNGGLKWKFSHAPYVGSLKIWYEGNDGAASGLDADLLDGQHGSYYLNYANFTGTPPGGLPSGGVQYNVLSKNSATAGDATWKDTAQLKALTIKDPAIPTTYGFLSTTTDMFALAGQTTGIAVSMYAHYNGGAPYWYFSHPVLIQGNYVWHQGNDGAASGLDADLLDGVQGAAYTQKAVAETITAAWSFNGQVNFGGNSYVTANGDFYSQRGDTPTMGVYYFGDGSKYLVFDGSNFQLIGGGALYIGSGIAFTTANDGPGSTLDADLLDGKQGAAYAVKADAEYISGTWAFAGSWGTSSQSGPGGDNLNAEVRNGIFSSSYTTTGVPAGAAAYGTTLQLSAGSNIRAQMYMRATPGVEPAAFIRNTNDYGGNTDIWTAWCRLLNWRIGVPTTASSAGGTGDVAYDSSYFYVCDATNSWKRTPLAAWSSAGLGANSGNFWRGDGIWTNTLAGWLEVRGGRTMLTSSSDPYSIGLFWNATRRDAGQGCYIGASDAASPDLVVLPAGVEQLRVTGDGRLYGKNLHVSNNSLVAGTTNQYVASGIWTPSVTNEGNCTGLSSGTCQYLRVGNVVSFSGFVNATPSSGGGSCYLSFTTPIPSAFYGYENACGSGCDAGGLNEAAALYSTGTANRIYMRFYAATTTARAISFSGSYVIV